MGKSIVYKHSTISYSRFGSGDEFLFALHGYGQDAQVFNYFSDVLATNFTVISIDLFEHGTSVWNEEESCSAEDLLQIFKEIAIAEKKVLDKFSLLAFSIGTRYAMVMAQTFPQKVNQLVLIAPPSFSFDRLLRFTVNTKLGVGLFRYFISNHQRLLAITNLLYQIKMIGRQKMFFVTRFIKDKLVLQKVYKTWYSYRKFIPKFKLFVDQMNALNIKVVLIVGKDDAITPPKDMMRIVQQIKNHRIHMIHEGHKLQTTGIKDLVKQL